MLYLAKSNFEKCVTAWNKHIHPDLFSLRRVFLIHLPRSSAAFWGPAETCSLAWVCISPVMKTDGLRKAMFFPALQLFTVPPCNLKYLHLPDINIKHHGRGEPPLLVTVQAVDHVFVFGGNGDKWRGGRFEVALASDNECTHASCLCACLFV